MTLETCQKKLNSAKEKIARLKELRESGAKTPEEIHFMKLYNHSEEELNKEVKFWEERIARKVARATNASPDKPHFKYKEIAKKANSKPAGGKSEKPKR